MPSIEHEPLDTVLGRYNINVIDIRNESYKEKKGVWRVKTSQGNKILKKVSYSEETLWFIMDAVRHLFERCHITASAALKVRNTCI